MESWYQNVYGETDVHISKRKRKSYANNEASRYSMGKDIKKKKRKKEKCEKENSNCVENTDELDEELLPPKKKKKKHHYKQNEIESNSNHEENTATNEHEEEFLPPKKKKKKNHDVQNVKESNVNCIENTQTNEHDAEFLPPKKKKKKHHDKQNEIERNSNCVKITETNEDVLPIKKKKKKHQQDEIDQIAASGNSIIVNFNEDTVEVKSKKKKKRHADSENSEDKTSSCEKLDEITSDDNEDIHKGCKKNQKEQIFDSQNQLLDAVKSDDNKRKHKKHKKDTCDESDAKNFNDQTVKNKKKKKHKEEKSEINEAESVNNSFDVENLQIERKRKKASFKMEYLSDNTAAIVEDQKEGDTIKKGHSNTDSKESGHKNATVNDKKSESKVNGKTNSPMQSGQWGTAFNENIDKQNKFLRLLGGFKKGAEDQTAKAQKFSSKFANYAMDQSTEKTYQSKLEQQYEKAMATNLQRGIGLGFQQPPDAGKKFYIDIGATKSVKFDN